MFHYSLALNTSDNTHKDAVTKEDTRWGYVISVVPLKTFHQTAQFVGTGRSAAEKQNDSSQISNF